MVMIVNVELKISEFVGLIPTFARTLVITLLGMGAFEILKSFLFPGISLLEFQGMTVIFVTTIAGIVSCFVHRKTQRLEKEMEVERRMRIAAEEHMRRMVQKDGNSNVLQPGYA
ncbi:MAG: hypothetical protein NTY64_08330 [Deltaproteobacteria bacterium]|nr:hypothetical protein [Deltaproteobacteria bacterium]